MQSRSMLLKRKQRVATRMPATTEIIKGTLVEMRRVCGKPTCKCVDGAKHRCLCISHYVQGKPRMVYVPRHQEDQVRRCIENYARIKRCISELSELNLTLLKRGT